MKRNSKPIKPIRQPRSRTVNEAFFIILVVLSLTYLLALISHSPLENPYSSSNTLGLVVLNHAGAFGACISDVSFSLLGYSSYLIPIALAWLGWRIHKNSGKMPHYLITLLRFLFFIVLLLFTAALFSIETPDPLEGGGAIAGGDIGYLMHQYFSPLFASAASIIYLGIIMISFNISSATSWITIFSTTTNILAKLLSKYRLSRIKAKNKAAAKKVAKMAAKTKTVKPTKTSIFARKKALQNKTKKIIKKPVKTSSNLFNTDTLSGLPDLSLLDEIATNNNGYSEQELNDMSRQVELKLKDFGFDVSITTVIPGPVVTQFELSLAAGVKVSQIMNLNKDLARALLVESVRIVDVIPGKPVIGLEIPNSEREMIALKEILASDAFTDSSSMLTMGLGKDINGHPVIANLAKMPHLLVAGATGMGKSVSLNAIILSILYKARPDEVRMIMIDPKIVELACYIDIPHLLTPVVTDMNEAAAALRWSVNEMERRYSLLAKFGVRNIEGFNNKLKLAKEKGKPLLDPSFNPNIAEQGETAPELETLPLIMLVIDEFADMLSALAQEDRAKAKRVEALIVRLAQKARAAGIHLIIATQRPSVDVITGLIKSNIPTRIAFKVSSKVDSRTVLDQGGAEQLLGMGDMLYMTPGISHLTRIHGAFVADGEIERVVGFLRENSQTNYLDGILNASGESADSLEDTTNDSSGEMDPLYDEAVQIVSSSRRASISSLQRRLRIGYNRAARIIEDMEASGVVSTMNGAGNRQVLAPEPINDN